MKKTILSILLASFLFSSCDDDEVQPYPETCTVQDQRSHPNNDSARLFIPNAFTPNNDGINDGFGPLTYDITAIDFTVFDVSGTTVFHTTQVGQPWLPSTATAGAQYTYQVIATAVGGDQMSWCGSVYALPCIPAGIDRSRLIFGDQFDPATPEGYIKGSSRESFTPCD